MWILSRILLYSFVKKVIIYSKHNFVNNHFVVLARHIYFIQCKYSFIYFNIQYTIQLKYSARHNRIIRNVLGDQRPKNWNLNDKQVSRCLTNKFNQIYDQSKRYDNNKKHYHALVAFNYFNQDRRIIILLRLKHIWKGILHKCSHEKVIFKRTVNCS